MIKIVITIIINLEFILQHFENLMAICSIVILNKIGIRDTSVHLCTVYEDILL